MATSTISRRRFGRLAATVGTAAAASLLAACGGGGGDEASPSAPTPPPPTGDRWRMPDEGEPHLRTWMAFGASREIWSEAELAVVRDNLAAIASAIAEFEPVTMLVRAEEVDLARSKCGPRVELLAATMNDFWMRDMGPLFVKNAAGAKAAVDTKFNGWGNRQRHELDAAVAAFTARAAGVASKRAPLVLEGGGIEVDGRGTAIITESCVLNDNRNPGLSKADAEAQLKALLGLSTIIWLPGIRNRDITDAHTDFYARFASPGTVLAHLDNDPASYDYAVTRQHLSILRAARDAQGNTLNVLTMAAPTTRRPPNQNSATFAAGYINFYVVNGGVIAPQFGDTAADGQAQRTLQNAFPGRRVVQLDIDGLAAGGGGIHCTTQQEPV